MPVSLVPSRLYRVPKSKNLENINSFWIAIQKVYKEMRQSVLPFFRSIPIVLLAPVKRGDGGHFLFVQCKAEQIQILQDVLRIA